MRTASRLLHAACAVALLLAFAGCAHRPAPLTQPPPVAELPAPELRLKEPSETTAPSEPPTYLVGAGDVLDIELLGEPNTLRRCLILPDGHLHYGILDGLHVEGRTLDEVRSAIESQLTRYHRNPQIGVTLRQIRSRRVWVLGRVNTPGIYPLDQPLTLVEAVARAGGFFTSRFSGTTEELVDLGHSFLMRDGQRVPVDFVSLFEQGDTSQDVALHPGDYLYFPSALSQEVYVLGAVNAPKAIGFRDRITLLSAISAAKDVRTGARAGRVIIIRGSLAEPSVHLVDYRAIRAGEAPDVRLQPRDIVWVPDRPWEDLERYARTILQVFVRTVAANEGANFAVPGGRANIVTPVGGP